MVEHFAAVSAWLTDSIVMIFFPVTVEVGGVGIHT
jgi:hypothetical protein